MKYYKNPTPKNNIEIEKPCINCEVGYENYTAGKDEYGEYIEVKDCKETCEKYTNYINSYWENIYSEFINEDKMKALNKTIN